MNPEQLAAIKARAGIGTPTPEHDCAAQGYGCERCQSEADASAADVPALVAEVERLRGIEAAAKAMPWWGFDDDPDPDSEVTRLTCAGCEAEINEGDQWVHNDPCQFAELDAAIRAAGSGE